MNLPFLFKGLNAKSVIRGKEDFLYELNYIKAFNGEDFLGSEAITEKVDKIKLIQEKLADMDKTLLVCFTPGKASFYPEYIPEEMEKPQTDSVNYKVYKNKLEAENVNFIDMNSWFIAMKDTCDCPLYPKYGIHWSHYGMLLAVDSLVNYIETARNIEMPRIEYGEMERSSDPRYTDYDIGAGMNLMFNMKWKPLCYPNYSFEKSAQAIQPKTLVVSDSFYWGMFNIGIGSSIFDLGGFWFYNQGIYPDSYDTPITVSEIDFKTRVLENDVILLMSTDANLAGFDWGFIDSLAQALGLE